MGRPSLYTPELGARICERLAKGELLIDICESDEMPRYTTVLDWSGSTARRIPEFAEIYARAKELRLERMAEELVKLSDTPQLGEKVKTSDGKTEIVTGDMIEHRRLQVETRKWLLARLAAKTYGDKLTQQHTGPDGGPVAAHLTINVVDSPSGQHPS